MNYKHQIHFLNDVPHGEHTF